MERKLTIEYGEEILLGLGLSPEQFSAEAKFRSCPIFRAVFLEIAESRARLFWVTYQGAAKCNETQQHQRQTHPHGDSPWKNCAA